ncbi:hypothetical protein GGI12_001912 [Dipsacomyces acuminosporus]|nr:hypothetical protein GGI12_001912 [Dipsacomyces acuminosporus]
MSGNLQFPSMAAHTQFVPANFEPAYVHTQSSNAAVSSSMAHQASTARPTYSLGRKFAPKRGRSSDVADSPAMDMDSFGEHQRCVYMRKSVVFTSSKRTKARQADH